MKKKYRVIVRFFVNTSRVAASEEYILLIFIGGKCLEAETASGYILPFPDARQFGAVLADDERKERWGESLFKYQVLKIPLSISMCCLTSKVYISYIQLTPETSYLLCWVVLSQLPLRDSKAAPLASEADTTILATGYAREEFTLAARIVWPRMGGIC